jgi:2'-5' RNA ligase
MEIVDSIAKQIAVVHQSRRPAGSEIRPHITLGGCEDLDIERCEAVLSDLASTPHTCRFDSLGAFVTDPAVVFAAPVVTSGLLDLHTRFHDRFATIASEQCAYYLPGRWVPHCTLVEGLPLATLPEAMRIASTLALPLFATFAAIQIVDIPAARVLRTFSTTPD